MHKPNKDFVPYVFLCVPFRVKKLASGASNMNRSPLFYEACI
jgi:hypothetical protein